MNLLVSAKVRWISLVGGGAIACVLGASSCERIAFYSTKPTEGGSSTSATGSSGGTSGVTRGAVLDAIASCQVDLLASFVQDAEAFEVAATVAKDDPAGRAAARTAWAKAIDKWQQAEVFQFGPAAHPPSPGGLSLRDPIYSWPLVSRCLVEQNIVSKAYVSPDFGTSSLVNMRGLAAAEYLLFYAATDNACSPATPINVSGSWAALGSDEIAKRKAHYAAVVAVEVAKSGRTLHHAWRADGDNFVAQFRNAGSPGSAYSSEQMALNAASDALFYVEIAVKDLKLGRPLGLVDCDTTLCPEAVESRFAGRSRTHIRNNLLGVRMMFNGCEAGKNLGFDDLLIASGAGLLASNMTSAIDQAILAADAVPTDDIAQALVTAPTTVSDLHTAVKAITNLLKTEFVTVLDLEPPQTVEGDND